MTSVAVSNTGTVNLSAYGIAASSDGTFSFDGAVNKIMSILDSQAPKFVKNILAAAAAGAAEVAATEAAFATAVAALPAEIGAAAAVLGPFVPIAAAVGAIVPILLAIDPAGAGLGCCGEPPHKVTMTWYGKKVTVPVGSRFGSCSPKEWDWYGPSGPGGTHGNQWAGDHWASGNVKQPWTNPNPWEQYIGSAIIGAYNAGSDCWHSFPPYAFPIVLAAAIGAWNRTHQPNRQVKMPGGKTASLPPLTVYRVVNADGTSTWQGKSSVIHGQPDDPTDPISVALNYAAMNWGKDGKEQGFHVPANRTVSFKVNGGALIAPTKGASLVANFPHLMTIKAAPSTVVPPAVKMSLGVKPALPSIQAAGAGAPKTTAPGMTVAGIPAKTLGIGAAVVGALAVGWHFFAK